MEEEKAAELLIIWDSLEAVLHTDEDFHFFFDRLLDLRIFNACRRWDEIKKKAGEPDEIPDDEKDN